MARHILTALALLSLASFAGAAPPDRPSDQAMLSQLLRGLLLKNLPDPLLESAHDWGRRADITTGWKIEKQGAFRWKAIPQTVTRNDGHWQKVRVQALEPDKTLDVVISNIRTPEPGKTHFDAVVKLKSQLTYEHQLYKAGARLYAGETRATCNSELKLVIEVTNRFDLQPGALLPNLAFRIHVISADLTYSDLVCEHTLGLGGDAAKLLGQAVHELIKKVKPNLESDLLAKANAAIVKAADTKEVKVELGKLLGAK